MVTGHLLSCCDMGPSFFDHDGLRGADTVARLALGAVVLVDLEPVPELHHGVEGAGLLATSAEDAVLGQYPVRPPPLAELIFARNAYIGHVPMRQGGHFPQDSLLVKDRKNLATSTMQSSSSRTTIPPEPMMEPTVARVSKSTC